MYKRGSKREEIRVVAQITKKHIRVCLSTDNRYPLYRVMSNDMRKTLL